MKKEQKEREVIINGEIDLSLMPKDILDMLVSALTENIEQTIGEEEK